MADMAALEYVLEHRYHPALKVIAGDLRDLADTVERASHNARPDSEPRAFVETAARVVHDVHNALANLHLGLLLQAASDAQTAATEHPAPTVEEAVEALRAAGANVYGQHHADLDADRTVVETAWVERPAPTVRSAAAVSRALRAEGYTTGARYAQTGYTLRNGGPLTGPAFEVTRHSNGRRDRGRDYGEVRAFLVAPDGTPEADLERMVVRAVDVLRNRHDLPARRRGLTVVVPDSEPDVAR